MKLKMIVVASVMACAAVANADTYQSEVRIGAISSDYDGVTSPFGSNFNDRHGKTNSYDLWGSYNFKEVKTDNLPLAEAAYFGKNSNVFAYALDRPKQHGWSSSQTYEVGAEIYVPENFLYVSAGVDRTSCCGRTDNDWFTTVGVTPIDGLRVTTTYNSATDYKANLQGKYVTEVGGHFINVEAGLGDANVGTAYMLSGDFYFDNTFSLGGSITTQNSQDTYSVRLRKFFYENISGELSYTNAPYDNIFTAGLSFRF